MLLHYPFKYLRYSWRAITGLYFSASVLFLFFISGCSICSFQLWGKFLFNSIASFQTLYKAGLHTLKQKLKWRVGIFLKVCFLVFIDFPYSYQSQLNLNLAKQGWCPNFFMAMLEFIRTNFMRTMRLKPTKKEKSNQKQTDAVILKYKDNKVKFAQQTFTCSKSIIETLKKVVKYVQS